MSEPMRVISLGWGVQSFGLAAMSALGALPKVDVAIHADTGHETSATYEFAKAWSPWLEDHGIPVVTVQPNPKDRFSDSLLAWGTVMLPAFTDSDKGGGFLRRSCTDKWKIKPIRRWLQANRTRRPVEMWLGISADEAGRVKPSDVGYVTNRWPLLEASQGRSHWRREDVRAWLLAHRLEVPPRSACYFCPFHSRAEWRTIAHSPDWSKAVAVDEAVRNARPPFQLYLHGSRIPLVQVDFRSEQERGQMEMDLFDNECTGNCGL